MPHRIYTTAGFVIESRPYGEAGKMLSIFTRELGMVNAAASGIRLGQSKLRYHVQDFSLAEFSLVRGRDIWRLVGAEKKSEEKLKEKSGRNPNPLFIRTLTTLRRLIHGEEKNEDLFETVIAIYNFLNEGEADESVRISSAEPIIMLRILNHLGYISIPAQPKLAPFLADNSFAPELIEKMSILDIKSLAIKEINKALQESHL
jgi:DNA repair protein RecO (recombination protein O)